MIIAWLKLRKRNLGPILDANGWAVNAKAKINMPFGGSLTRSPRCRRARSGTWWIRSPRRRRPWGLYITLAAVVVLAICWYFGKLDRALPGQVRSTSFWARMLGLRAAAGLHHQPAARQAD